MKTPAVTTTTQGWSTAQKDIWKNIETDWDNFAKGDFEAFLSSFHPDFRGFVDWRTLPLDKKEFSKWIRHAMQTTKISVYTIEPASIIINGNMAIVHFYCDLNMSVGQEKQILLSYRYTNILVKESGKWLVLGAHKEKAK